MTLTHGKWGSTRKTNLTESEGLQNCNSSYHNLQLGQDEIPSEDYMTMGGEDNIEAEYCMSGLVDMALR